MLQSQVDWKMSVAANLSEKAINFLLLQDAMKMSMVQKGLAEQEAEEIICEVLRETSEQYRNSNLKEKIKIEVTDVYHATPWGFK
jgi:hypothetical protein